MKRAFYLFMQGMKVKKGSKRKKLKDSKMVVEQNITGHEETVGPVDMFDDDLYGQNDFRAEMFTDNFYNEYDKEVNNKENDTNVLTVDKDFRVSRKEALTSIETKSPFIVGKMNGKKACIEEDDIIYKTVSKLSYKENHNIRLVGHMEVFKAPRSKRVSEKDIEKSLGIINDEYLVSKRKGFNQSKIGYLKLENDNSGYDKYIQINRSKGLRPILGFIIICGLILLVSKVELPEGWNFDNLTLYQVQERIEKQDISVEVLHDESVAVLDGKAAMQFQTISEKELGIEIVISCNGKEIYRSARMSTSEYEDTGSLEFVVEGYRAGEYNCSLICEVYRANKFIGKLESEVVINE